MCVRVCFPWAVRQKSMLSTLLAVFSEFSGPIVSGLRFIRACNMCNLWLTGCVRLNYVQNATKSQPQLLGLKNFLPQVYQTHQTELQAKHIFHSGVTKCLIVTFDPMHNVCRVIYYKLELGQEFVDICSDCNRSALIQIFHRKTCKLWKL